MVSPNNKYTATVPFLNLEESRDMLTNFTTEAHKYILNAKNAFLIVETVPDDQEAIDNIFKAFHTIKGLASFLNLEDISLLSERSETLMDLTRKCVLTFEGKTSAAAKEAIDSLYQLIELLNEQIQNGGELKSPYHDISPVLKTIDAIIAKTNNKPSRAASATMQKEIPEISIPEESQIFNVLEEKMKTADKEVAVDKASLQELIKDSKHAHNELKEVHSKVLENQRELVKERELAIKLTQQAQSMARAKSEYLASMAHEIRTLINAILGFSNLLSQGSLNSKQKEQLDTIILSGNLLSEIVNDILDFSKVEAGKLKLESIKFDLRGLVTDVFKIIRTRLNGKPINLFFEIGRDVPSTLIGDPTRVKQIFINLLDNAIKFTEKGEIGLMVSLGAQRAAFDKKYELHFIIQDSGMGISKDVQETIFESFTQASSSITRRHGGTGLGLTLCKNYIENMGGKIWVESEVGKGSKFIFTANFEVEKPKSDQELPQDALKELEGRTVLVVENNQRTQNVLESLCKKYKMKVLPASDNFEGVISLFSGTKSTKKSLPDIIFVDMLLPDKNAYTLAYKIKQDSQYQSIKLIAVCVDVSQGSSEEILQQGFNGSIAKPIIEDEFIKVLSEVSGQVQRDVQKLTEDMIEKISCEGVRILVAEDSLPNQELLKVHFESLGCDVDYVSNGQEAVEKARANDYDICFMDLQMPTMGGLEATSVIKDDLKKTFPIVALTAAEIEEERETCLEVGMSDYLPKPFELIQLKRKIIKCTKM